LVLIGVQVTNFLIYEYFCLKFLNSIHGDTLVPSFSLPKLTSWRFFVVVFVRDCLTRLNLSKTLNLLQETVAEVITDGSIESLEQYLDIDELPDPEAEPAPNPASCQRSSSVIFHAKKLLMSEKSLSVMHMCMKVIYLLFFLKKYKKTEIFVVNFMRKCKKYYVWMEVHC